MPPQSLLTPLLDLAPLARLPRTGWLLAGVADPETVAAALLHDVGMSIHRMAIRAVVASRVSR